MTYRNRIKEMTLVKASDLMNNDGNWRMHPLFQGEALEGLLEEIGITDVLKAYYSQRNGGKLTLTDGHLRKSRNPDQVWPVIILDIDDDEADLQLLLGDSITEWAQTDPVKKQHLIEQAKIANEKAKTAVARLRESIAHQVEIAKRAADKEMPKSDRLINTAQRAASVKVVVQVGDELATVEKALKATGLKRRGDALAELARYYLENHG